MPERREIFTNGNYYHIYNKTIDKRAPFVNNYLCALFLDTAKYYRASTLRLPFSQLKLFDPARRAAVYQQINNECNFRVNILAYCLMPNHFHFLLRQNIDGGVERFISNTLNSFTRFYNRSISRKGPLFLPRFSSVAIVSTEQLLTVCKYILCNPLQGGLVHNYDELRKYKWCSYKDYLTGIRPMLTESTYMMEYFNHDTQTLCQFIENDLDQNERFEYVRQFELGLFKKRLLRRPK